MDNGLLFELCVVGICWETIFNFWWKWVGFSNKRVDLGKCEFKALWLRDNRVDLGKYGFKALWLRENRVSLGKYEFKALWLRDNRVDLGIG